MYILIAAAVLLALAAIVAIDFGKRRRRRKRYPEQPDGVRKCTSCGRALAAGVTDCPSCGSDTVVIVV